MSDACIILVTAYSAKSNNKIFVNHCYQTRHNANKMMSVPFRKYDANQRFASILAPKIFNVLPLEIRTLTRYRSFVDKAKDFVHRNADHINGLL